MLQPSIPWWEFPLRAVVVYAVLLILIRLSGKRTVGQFTPFDLLGLSGGDESVTGGLLVAASLVLLNVVVAVSTSRSSKLQELVEWHAVLVGRDGRLFDDLLRKNHVPRPDVERALREADCDLKDMKFAFLEADGRVSILKESAGVVGASAD